MDAFKSTVIVAVLVSWVALGFIYFVASDSVLNAKIPDLEYGSVASKELVKNEELVYYRVILENGKTLHIPTNNTLYDSLQVNQSYLFECRIDLTNKLTIIDKATQPPGRAP